MVCIYSEQHLALFMEPGLGRVRAENYADESGQAQASTHPGRVGLGFNFQARWELCYLSLTRAFYCPLSAVGKTTLTETKTWPRPECAKTEWRVV